MSENEQNKSEAASPFKLEKARKKGSIARSTEWSLVATIVAVSVLMYWDGARRTSMFVGQVATTLASSHSGNSVWSPAAHRLVFLCISSIAPVLLIAALAAAVPALIQTRFLFAPDALRMDFNRISPAAGFKRLFSKDVLVQGLKSALKLVIYSGIGGYIVFQGVVDVLREPVIASALPRVLALHATRLVIWLASAAFIFALVDWVLVKRKFAKSMQMSRREQREEVRQREGDPRIRARRRQVQRELVKRASSMRRVRDADFVVTNPTHFAVGLQYRPNDMNAPKVLAKGAGEFAARLKRVAFVYGVPVIEAPALARALFHRTAIDQVVPEHLYADTATVYLQARRAREGH